MVQFMIQFLLLTFNILTFSNLLLAGYFWKVCDAFFLGGRNPLTHSFLHFQLSVYFFSPEDQALVTLEVLRHASAGGN